MPLGHWLIIHLKKVFIGKEKKAINILIAFFIYIYILLKTEVWHLLLLLRHLIAMLFTT